MMAHHEHIQMLVHSIFCERPRRVRRRRKDHFFTTNLDNIRRVASTGTLGVICVNSAALECLDGFFDAA